MHGSRIWLYQGCGDQLWVTKIIVIPPFLTFERTLPISEKGGKPIEGPGVFHFCWRARCLTVKIWFQAIVKLMTSSGGVDDQRYRLIIWNTLADNRYSLESWKLLDQQSALNFSFPGRYSALIIIFRDRESFQISLTKLSSPCFQSCAFSSNMVGSSRCSLESGLLSERTSCERLIGPDLLLWVLAYWYVTSNIEDWIDFLLMFPYSMPPSSFKKHLFEW